MTDREREQRLEEDLKRARRGRRLVVAAAVTVCLVAGVALAGAVVANVVNIGQGNDITKIQRSPCTLHPNGRECQSTKRRSDEAASLPTLCVQFKRVDREHRLLRLTKCEDDDGTLLERPEGGDASQSPSSATQQRAPGSPAHPTASPGGSTKTAPSRHDASSSPGSTGTHSQGNPAAPPSSTAPSSGRGSSSSSTTVIERAPPAAPASPEAPTVEAPAAPERPVPTAVGGLIETVGGTAGEVGATGTGTVEGMTSKACEATGLLCSK
jgi:hypothetical protein